MFKTGSLIFPTGLDRLGYEIADLTTQILLIYPFLFSGPKAVYVPSLKSRGELCALHTLKERHNTHLPMSLIIYEYR